MKDFILDHLTISSITDLENHTTILPKGKHLFSFCVCDKLWIIKVKVSDLSKLLCATYLKFGGDQRMSLKVNVIYPKTQ
ncbi:hypothetical protein SAMN05216378_1705 [Paenibacillus catalpae]|uniref:Uncharacterized protein n=1 Tax=Paenibacillus catalpae TaxID=1045775 RepID=A0A1I1VNE6_9BACL|nr:hypothetical protein SAMN05216378_1705 [Paenibacillus catalpae]